MHMHKLRTPRKVAREVSNAFGKENEPLRVVRIINLVLIIETGSIKKLRAMDEIYRDSFAGLEGPDLGPHPFRAEGQLEIIIEPFEFRKTLPDAAVKRSNH